MAGVITKPIFYFSCFSISLPFFEILLEEFSKDIKLKRRTLNTDPHLWVPLTSEIKEYQKEGGNPLYWKRIKKIKEIFQKKSNKKRIIGVKDLGKKTIWWDYGHLRLYFLNVLKLTEKSREGEIAREFFGVKKYWIENKISQNLKIKNSLLIDSKIKSGEIENTILIASKISKAKIKNGVIICSKTKDILPKKDKEVKNILLYNVKEEKNLIVEPAEVITDIIPLDGTKIRMRTTLLRDGKRDWKVRLPQNVFAYSEIERFLARVADDTLRFRI